MKTPDVKGLIEKYQSLESLAQSFELMARRLAKDAYKARVDLERFSAPAPKGGRRTNENTGAANEIILKRNQRIVNAKAG
ncbi:MAG TPA: hypothetical protein DCQ29_02085 [Chitinophagaceae bacterium]|nr:hypothetical protein [Chitinophagaceae bacterium]